MADSIDWSAWQAPDAAQPTQKTDNTSIDWNKWQTTDSAPSASTAPIATDSPPKDETGIDWSKWQSPDSSTASPGGWNSPIDNPIVHGVGNALGMLGDGIHAVEQLPVIHNIAGAFAGAAKPVDSLIENMQPGSGIQGAMNDITAIPKAYYQAVPGAIKGLIHPDQAIQDYQQQISGENGPDKFIANAVADPASFVPLGPIFKGIGMGGKLLSDAAGATPYIAKAADAVANAPGIKQAIGGTQDVLGKMFTPNYGANPDLVKILDESAGTKSVNQQNILNSLSDLSQGHGLTPDELNQTGHVIEGTLPGTPEQQAFAQKWRDLADNGPQMPNGATPIGTNAMLHTASAVNGEPLLQGTIPNWFKHMYDNVPDELKGVFPKHEYGTSGLSTTGSFNLTRTFPTLQDAQAAGLKPELDPFHVQGEHLNQSSNALANNSVIQQVKNTPGILFPKDPIDEVAKLVKTGRMTANEAAMHLGMSMEDLQKGFVQSKVPQLSGAYIRPADESALMEHLSPTMPTGPFAAISKLNNLYNKGFLLNPLPHMHNIYTNGVGLGGADTGYIKQTLDALNKGQIDPWHARATQAGAINNAVGGKFSDAIDRAVAPQGNVFSKTGSAIKDSFSSLPTSAGDLVDKIKAPFQPALDASHNLLWNNDAAIRTSLFRGAVESGATDAEAAAHANKFMVDYNNLTPFEKQYVKPLINFYAWKKGNIPLQATQMLAQTPKYAAYVNAKNAVSQMVSGQPTDDKGRINTNQQLSDGSHTVIDPYSPMDEVNKIGDKGLIQFLYNSLNPGLKEGITQGTSIAQAAGLPIQNKFPIYNPAAPAGYNVRAGIAHLVNAMNPLNSSAVLGQAGSQSNLINHIFGMPTNNKPDQTTVDFITKMMGGFTARGNPATDAKTQYYQQKDNAVNFKKYQKDLSKAK